MELSFPFIPAWNQSLHAYWFEHSKTLFEHRELTQCEKLLWIWLATTSERADEHAIRCSNSIEQIAIALNKSCDEIQRQLFRLKLMGFLRVNLPLRWDNLPTHIIKEVRKMVLYMPTKVFLNNNEALTILKNSVHHLYYP